MANNFLVKKWKQLFHLNDIDKDNLLTLKDADLFAENFAAAYKFDEEKAKQIKEKCHKFWKSYILIGATKQVSEEEYVQNLTNQINADREKLRSDLIESMKVFAEIIDVDNDGLISSEELKRFNYAWGMRGELDDEPFLAKFRHVKPGFMTPEDYSGPWVDHLTNPDETVANPVSEKLNDLSDAGLLPQ